MCKSYVSIGVDFTELSNEEFYRYLHDANSKLTGNYYQKENSSTLQQLEKLYLADGETFRGFSCV